MQHCKENTPNTRTTIWCILTSLECHVRIPLAMISYGIVTITRGTHIVALSVLQVFTPPAYTRLWTTFVDELDIQTELGSILDQCDSAYLIPLHRPFVKVISFLASFFLFFFHCLPSHVDELEIAKIAHNASWMWFSVWSGSLWFLSSVPRSEQSK